MPLKISPALKAVLDFAPLVDPENSPLELVAENSPSLHESSLPFYRKELSHPFIKKLIEMMRARISDTNCASLSANQFGLNVQLIVIEHQTEEEVIPFQALFNCRINELSKDKTYNFEGCLNIPGHVAAVLRSTSIIFSFLDQFGKPHLKVEAKGVKAIILQHETDHLNGKLYTEKSHPESQIALNHFSTKYGSGEAEALIEKLNKEKEEEEDIKNACVKEIEIYAEAVVSKRLCQPVDERYFKTPEINKLIKSMFDLMNRDNAKSLTAIQVGIPLAIAIIRDENERLIPMINPEITEKSNEKFYLQERCMSIPDYFAATCRSAIVEVSYSDEGGSPFKRRFEGDFAIRAQHAIDHLGGIFYKSHAVTPLARGENAYNNRLQTLELDRRKEWLTSIK